MTPRRTLARLLLALLCFLGSALPASAAVTLTFWSHELGSSFPHAFITLRGVPDAGGAPVDMNIGFTARHISPAILFGTVSGMLEPADGGYLDGSDAQFQIVLSDAQYVEVLKVLAEFGPKGDQHYNLNHRNCVTFTQVVAQRIGLKGTDQPGLIKKPRSYMQAVAAANSGTIAVLNLHGREYMAGLKPVPGVDPKLPILAATGTPSPELAFASASATAAPTAVITSQSMDTKGAKAPAATTGN